MTSAIPGLSVAEVRRALLEVRRRASTHCADNPFYLSDELSHNGGMTAQYFCLEFVRGHSDKRHNKGKKDEGGEGEEKTTKDEGED